jgi:hypothetical protein
MAKQPVILIDEMNSFAQWIEGGYPFDRAKSCNLCVTQHACLRGCSTASHLALRKAAQKLTKDWSSASPINEEQAQGILKLRRKFYRFFATAPKAHILKVE